MSWEDDEFDVDLNDSKNFNRGTGFSDEEDDGVKDAWDADSDTENNPAVTETKTTVTTTKKKKGLKQILKEKEEKKQKELEEKMAQAELEADPEDEKRQRQILVEQADLDLAKDMFGGVEDTPVAVKEKVDENSIDKANPRNRSQFDKFAKNISARLRQYEDTPFYLSMVEQIAKELTENLDYEDTRKVAQILNVSANDKQRIEKEKKKGGKKKKGATMKMERGNDDGSRGRFENDMDDYM
ncbi:hypothetical protein SARC_00197 [Sphaeroforma arctica JP610]|uniref:Uncharacterized protein n=1 Tax=Sphaeroforma arctica JP610 TaxID=667725 RepID=A0A0L0GFR9_9EUKA|nr:hypothetical protein SARC_00197 [Sphaeroforma arctica JP610]KNC87689.1 hypothetical protein SARC_00197 [Sphaeroforma arctica JP610]|eukprot:XP_014161591.1 hypothetical protein SARC_00197 [Sphaeroforma arctica JP610]